MTDSKIALVERVFDRIEKMRVEPTAPLMFAIAIELWAEDRKKTSKGFVRAKGEDQEPARSSRHDID